MVPFTAGLIGVMVVLAGIVYYLSRTDEAPPPPMAQVSAPEVVPVSLNDLRDLQTAIRTAQDETDRSKEAAETAQAKTRAPNAFGRAQALHTEASARLEHGATLIAQRQYADAKAALEGSLDHFGQAHDAFGQAKDAAEAGAAEEKKRRQAEAERAKKAREAAKQAAPAKKAAPPVVASVPKPPSPPAPPKRPDIEVVGAILSDLKSAYERRDLRALQQVSLMSDGRARFLQQIFQEYSAVGVSISGLSMTSETASAVVSITKLVNRQGDPVIPGAEWKNTKVVIKKQSGEWGKVLW